MISHAEAALDRRPPVRVVPPHHLFVLDGAVDHPLVCHYLPQGGHFLLGFDCVLVGVVVFNASVELFGYPPSQPDQAVYQQHDDKCAACVTGTKVAGGGGCGASAVHDDHDDFEDGKQDILDDKGYPVVLPIEFRAFTCNPFLLILLTDIGLEHGYQHGIQDMDDDERNQHSQRVGFVELGDQCGDNQQFEVLPEIVQNTLPVYPYT